MYAHIETEFSGVKIMIVTVFEGDDKIYRAIAAGASGYILKRSEPDILIKSINDLIAGGAPMSSSIAFKVINSFRSMIPNEMYASPLTEREQEILSLLSSGHRNRDVAVKLNISIATVKSHIYSIYQKLHVRSKIEAINKFRPQPKG